MGCAFLGLVMVDRRVALKEPRVSRTTGFQFTNPPLALHSLDLFFCPLPSSLYLSEAWQSYLNALNPRSQTGTTYSP